MTFTGSKLSIDGQVKLKMVSAIFPIRSKLDYVALLILQHADCQTAVKDLMSWECFSQGKVKRMVLGIPLMTLSSATRIIGLRCLMRISNMMN